MSDAVARPLFSVVIPTHNRPDELVEAVDSVLAQTVQDIEIIVVDDGSTVPVGSFDDPRVRVVRRDRPGGPAVARNEGVALAHGRYLAFLDDDDWYRADRLQVALDGLERAPIALCWGGYLDRPPQPGLTLNGEVHDVLLDHGYAPNAGVAALRRECFVPFDPRFKGAEDIDWWLRLTEQHQVATVPSYAYLVRHHDERRDERVFQERLDGSLLLLEKHHDYFATHRRARAFRWRRIASYRAELGRRWSAAGAVLRSLAARPDPAVAVQLARTLVARPARPTPASAPVGYFASTRSDVLPHVPVVDTYLDLGCGEGRFGEALKERRPGTTVWGVEPNATAAQAARGRLDQVVVGAFPDCRDEITRTFDCVVANDVLEHIEDPWAACGELAALLQPGGVLVASIPNVRNFATLATLALQGRWDYVDAGVLDRTHLRFFTRATAVEMIEAAGLVVTSTHGAWPLTTVKMRALRAACRPLAPGLAREGRFRQYVVVARAPDGTRGP